MQPQLFTSDTAEHNTPADIIERMRYVFDGPSATIPFTMTGWHAIGPRDPFG
jgi:hypothetical protein